MAASKLNIENYVNDLAEAALSVSPSAKTPGPEQDRGSLESALGGLAIELWSDSAGRLFIVAGEDDARGLTDVKGTVYTAAEVRLVVQIGDPVIVREIHEWKRAFNGRIREIQLHKQGEEGVGQP